MLDYRTQKRLLDAKDQMDAALDMGTGLKLLDRKIVTYWTLATHTLHYQKVFPILVLRGPTGTGKSQSLDIIEKFAHNPHKFTARRNTIAVIKDIMIEAFEGTVIIDEADKGGFSYDDKHRSITQFEQIISDRYGRYSSGTTSKVKTDRDKWANINGSMFGATVTHSRVDYTDSALTGRSIEIQYEPDYTKPHMESEEMDYFINSGLHDFEFKPIEVTRPDQIAQRVFNSYRPVIMAAQCCNDGDFIDSLSDKLQRDSEAHKAAQSNEPIGLVFRAVFNITSTQDPKYSNIKLSSIVRWIQENYGENYSPKAIGTLARSLGFEVKESHGVGVVAPPSPTCLYLASKKTGYNDPESERELREKILKLPPEERG